MTTPNQQIPLQGQFRPGMQPVRSVMMNNRPPMMQQQGTAQPPPPSNLMNQQQPMVRPGFAPYKPTGQVRPAQQPGFPLQSQQQRPLPPQQHPGMMKPPPLSPPVEDQLSHMRLNNGDSSNSVHKPGRSKRVYAPVPNTPLPSTSPNRQQQPYQPSFQQQQQLAQQPEQQRMQYHHHQQQPMQQLQTPTANTPLGLPPRSTAKPRIDPNQIPSPVQIQIKDEQLYHQPDYYYGTCDPSAPLPLASTHFKALDQGNCHPSFMRSTLQTIPQTADLVRDTGLPLGLILQPLASTDITPPLIPLAREEGPIRCSRCKGYLNPWCKFVQGGKKFVCNLCEFENTVNEADFCPCDMSGRRMDTEQKPELMFGSVEFEVPKDYWADVEPKSLHWLVAIDVSIHAVQSGLLASACDILKETLANGLPQGVKIGIMTFDTSIHFYNLKAELEQASMMVVSDINDVFVPISEGLFVDPLESKIQIETLLGQLPSLHQQNTSPSAVFGPAVQSALLAMKSLGGKLSVIQSCLPSLGPGALKNRDDPKLYGTEREKGLFVPQESFYTQLASGCVENGVSVDVWLFPPANTYIDVATVGVLSALSGGDTHYFPNYNALREGIQFAHNFKHSIHREQGYRAALRLRCSNGLSVNDQYGNFHMSNATDIELANVNADTSVGIALKHDGGKIPENGPVYFQSALLYTTAQGQRRVRVHNLSLSVGTTANPVFKQADLDTSLNFLAKQTITLSTKKSINDLSNELDSFCVKILTAYRKYCASGASAAQLILPESFKVLPLLLSSFKKSTVLRKDGSLNVDTRVYNLRKIKGLSIAGTIRWLYPQCIKLHTWFEQPGDLVPLERTSYDRLDSTGMYWIQSHHGIFLWIGKNASPQLIENVFGTADFNQINPHMSKLPVLEHSTVNQQLRELYRKNTDNLPYLPQLHVIRHGMDLEVELSKVLVEDETFGQMNYVDYLCMIHKQIQTELEREKQDTVISSASYWAHRY